MIRNFKALQQNRQHSRPGTADVVLRTRDLRKSFGDFIAVRSIDLDIRRGEIFGFLGPNGAGKTTTIRMILGLLRPDSGTVSVLGIDVQEHPQEIRPRVGYMAQRFSLYDDLSVLQNLQFYGTAYGLSNDRLASRIGDALHMAGLQGRERQRTGDLAGGWRQRLALGAAILHEPEIVFLDEPTAGVDPASRRDFWDLLYKLAARGVTVFVTTHYMDEAEHCHRLAFIQRGELIAMGSPTEIKKEAIPGHVLEVMGEHPGAILNALQTWRDENDLALEIDLYGSLVHMVTPDNCSYIRQIKKVLRKAGVRFKSIQIVDPSLEDVFITRMR